jgi:hypothetical protein
MPTSAGP